MELTLDDYIEQYGDKLYRFCVYLVNNQSDVDDLYQETWIKVYKNIHKFDMNKSFMTWVTTICVNVYRDMLRKHRVKEFFIKFKSTEKNDLFLESIADINTDITQYTDLRDEINKLDERYRLPLILHYFQGYKIQEISQILDTSEGTIKSHLSNAKKLLKERIDIDAK